MEIKKKEGLPGTWVTLVLAATLFQCGSGGRWKYMGNTRKKAWRKAAKYGRRNRKWEK